MGGWVGEWIDGSNNKNNFMLFLHLTIGFADERKQFSK